MERFYDSCSIHNDCDKLCRITRWLFLGQSNRFRPLPCASLELAIVFAGGAIQATETGCILKGSGDILTMGVTAWLGVLGIRFLQRKTVALSMLLVPSITLFMAGELGRSLLPYITMITSYIRKGMASLLGLQPLFMYLLISMLLSILIVSLITTVGIALAISLKGIGSGAANLRIVCSAIGLCMAG